MKKLLLLVAAMVLAFTLAACTQAETYEVAMITDSGTIDDESFNQGTWEGIKEFCEDNDLSYKYYKPLEVSDDSYLDAIELAVEGGAKVVVTPGYLFETSVYAAQTQFPDVKFILIDGAPHSGDYNPVIEDNTLSIFFKEHESGFLAGYAAVKDGYTNLGFTGGMAVPAVVKFGIGFVAGAYYAAEEDGVTLVFGDDTYTYFGDFQANSNFKDLASGWYASGTQVIFSAAGGAGASVISAAVDAEAVMIGVDIDQGGQSEVVLTSAMKELGMAVKQALQTYVDDAWVGGVSVSKGAAVDGVALPGGDSFRFETFTTAQYDAIFADLADGTVIVPDNYTDLVTFLGDATGYPTENVILGTE